MVIAMHLPQRSKSILGPAHVVHQDVVDVLVRLLPVVARSRGCWLHHARHALLQDYLQLLLLLRRQELEVLQ